MTVYMILLSCALNGCAWELRFAWLREDQARAAWQQLTEYKLTDYPPDTVAVEDDNGPAIFDWDPVRAIRFATLKQGNGLAVPSSPLLRGGH